MSIPTPALLLFADDNEADKYKNSIYKYLADAGFEPDEVKNWGKIGSLVDAINDLRQEGEQQDTTECLLDQSYFDFVAKLPTGHTPRPNIRHQMQRVTPL